MTRCHGIIIKYTLSADMQTPSDGESVHSLQAQSTKLLGNAGCCCKLIKVTELVPGHWPVAPVAVALDSAGSS